MTKADLLASGLDDFLSVSPDVEAAAVVSADGLPMASALPSYVEEDRLAAMSAALLTLGERAATGLGKGELAQVFVEAAQGYVVLMAAGPSAVLVAVTSGSAKVGLVLFEMRKAAARVAEIMDGDVSSLIESELENELENAGAEAQTPATAEQAEPPEPVEAPEIPDPVNDFGDVRTSRGNGVADAPQESAISTWH
jgi:predicted regulator of Ras-like GTPase activity (Roadblock/LC7/MglB family)